MKRDIYKQVKKGLSIAKYFFPVLDKFGMESCQEFMDADEPNVYYFEDEETSVMISIEDEMGYCLIMLDMHTADESDDSFSYELDLSMEENMTLIELDKL